MENITNFNEKELWKILVREDARRSKAEIKGDGKEWGEAEENISFICRKLAAV